MELDADLYKNIKGTTDSEHAFYLFLNHLQKTTNKMDNK